jgi:hypothetical protein
MGEIFDLAVARAKRQAEDDAFEGLDALIEADLAAEQALPRERLSPEALAALRVDLIAAMSGAGARNTDRASVLHAVLYAMVRELLDQRACVATLRSAWVARQKNTLSQADFEDEIAVLAEVSELAEREILCSLGVVLEGAGG